MNHTKARRHEEQDRISREGVLTAAFVIFLASAWLSRDKRASLVLLTATIAIYPIGAIKGALS